MFNSRWLRKALFAVHLLFVRNDNSPSTKGVPTKNPSKTGRFRSIKFKQLSYDNYGHLWNYKKQIQLIY